MSFSFSFSGDDIEDDTPPTTHQHENNDTSTPHDTLTQKLQNTKLTSITTTLLPPKRHTLSDLLKSLPSQISYNYLDVPIQNADHTIRIPRRSLFDIRHQLMAESDPSNTEDETVSLLSGLETGDLRSGIYEGGFKTWECAVDLGGFVGREDGGDGEEGGEKGLRVVELGAGSAVPSLAVLEGLLSQRLQRGRETEEGQRTGKVSFTLCDYNEDVLRLGTAVNVFLVVALKLGVLNVDENMDDEDRDEEGDLEVDDILIQRVLGMLKEVNVEIDFISGAWGSDFVHLLKQEKEQGDQKDERLLMLASETIYSPDSLRVFSETVLDVLKSIEGDKKAYVAAKKVYFGVGGGVQEFEGEVSRLGGRTETVLDVRGSGVGRVVLEVFVG